MREEILKLLRDIEKRRTFKGEYPSVVQIFDPKNSTWDDYFEYQKKNEQEHLLKYDYEKFFEEDQQNHPVRSFLFFPNYRLIIDQLKEKYKNDSIISPQFFDRTIMAELQRMKDDKLIIIDNQEISEYILQINGDFTASLYGNGWKSKTDSIILTTKGKSYYDYIKETFKENPITIGISIISLIISIISMIIAILKK